MGIIGALIFWSIITFPLPPSVALNVMLLHSLEFDIPELPKGRFVITLRLHHEYHFSPGSHSLKFAYR
jgi:hypothetical protein